MTELLEYLNTAGTEDLQKLPGVGAAFAEKIIAARPFSSPEDYSKVSGLTDKKLAKIKEAFEKQDAEPAESGEIAAPEVEKAEEAEPDKPARKNNAGKVIAWILVILILLAGTGYAAVKWGLPFIDKTFLNPVEANTADINNLAAQQSTEVARLDDEIAALQERVDALEVRADAVDESLQSHDEALAQLESMQQTLEEAMAGQKSDLLAELDTQISLTRAIELLSRARLYLSESNYGLAKDDVQNCRDLLYTLLEAVPAEQADALKEVISRLDMALEKLPAYPVVAVYDVDTAWQYLIDGLPNVPEQAVTPIVLPSTETPATEATVEATMEITLESTLESTATAAP